MCTTEGSSILSCEGHREHLFSTTPTFVSDVFPLSQGLGAADLPVSLLLGQGPFLGFWCCDVCCPSGSLPTEGMDVQLAGQGAGGQQSSAGQLPHSVPAAVGCSERAGEAASLCCLLPLLSLCLGSEARGAPISAARLPAATCRQEEEEGGEGGGSMGWRQLPWHTAVPFVLESLAVSFGKKI